jgi:sulfur carrier protein
MTAIAIIHGLVCGRETVVASSVSAVAAKILLSLRNCNLSQSCQRSWLVPPILEYSSDAHGGDWERQISTRQLPDVKSHCLMRYISSMELFVNGESKCCADPSSLSQFIEQLGMKGDRVAVELNREIVPRAHWDSTQLHAGDHLEIVHFVGGGTDSC